MSLFLLPSFFIIFFKETNLHLLLLLIYVFIYLCMCNLEVIYYGLYGVYVSIWMRPRRISGHHSPLMHSHVWLH